MTSSIHLRRRLTTFGLAFVAVAFLAFLALATAVFFTQRANKLFSIVINRIELIAAIESELIVFNKDVAQGFAPLSPLEIARTQEKIDGLLNEFEGLTFTPEGHAAARQARSTLRNYFDAWRRLPPQADHSSAQWQHIFQQLDNLLAAIDALAQRASLRANEARDVYWSRLLVFISLPLVLCLMVIFAMYTRFERKYIHQPLGVIEQTIERFGAGDRKARITINEPRELVQISATFNQMADLLSRQLRSVAVLAHDLRTPLSAIKNSISLLSADRATHDAQVIHRHQEIALRQVDRLDRMISDLLDISRIEAGEILLRNEQCDLREIAEATIDLFAPVSPRHQLILNAPQHARLRCDPLRIEQSLHNLVNNAIKYSPDGGKVTVSIAETDGMWLLQVSDQGIGISPGELEHVFELFYRGEDANRVSGTGLGLSIVRRIMEMHGGRVEAESSLGVGSIFRCFLPRT